MTPLISEKVLYAFLFAALALVLAAPAGARPILDGAELGDTSAAVAPDAFERAVTAQAPAGDGTIVLRKSGTVVVTGKPDAEPAWLKALNARSQAMNDYYGAGSAGSVRPDDRATPRPVQTGVVSTSDGSGDGVAWEDVTAGALGGFGLALLLGLGGFALLHFHRRSSTIAH
jgi:hypothetical protein